jgi:hypothetical protein
MKQWWTRKQLINLEKINPTQRHKRDDAAYFTLVGGPHHGLRVRLYAPWDTLRYTDGAEYELHPPIGKKDEWVYIHTTKEIGE